MYDSEDLTCVRAGRSGFKGTDTPRSDPVPIGIRPTRAALSATHDRHDTRKPGDVMRSWRKRRPGNGMPAVQTQRERRCKATTVVICG